MPGLDLFDHRGDAGDALGARGGPRDALLALMQDTLDTRNDTLRELARRCAGQVDAGAETLAELLHDLEAGSSGDPTTAWLFQAMAEQLARCREGAMT